MLRQFIAGGYSGWYWVNPWLFDHARPNFNTAVMVGVTCILLALTTPTVNND